MGVCDRKLDRVGSAHSRGQADQARLGRKACSRGEGATGGISLDEEDAPSYRPKSWRGRERRSLHRTTAPPRPRWCSRSAAKLDEACFAGRCKLGDSGRIAVRNLQADDAAPIRAGLTAAPTDNTMARTGFAELAWEASIQLPPPARPRRGRPRRDRVESPPA